MSKVILILIAVLLAAFAADLDNSATTRAEIIRFLLTLTAFTSENNNMHLRSH